MHKFYKSRLFALSLWGIASTAAESLPAVEPPGFATCAAYYFLAARGHAVQDYDRLYSSGEFSLNEAAKRHGKPNAEAKMGDASGLMMKEMHQDWRQVTLLDTKYASECRSLTQEAGFRYE